MKRFIATLALFFALGVPTAQACMDHPLIAVQGNYYEVSAPNRPACYIEPSLVPGGWEVIFYPDRATRGVRWGTEVWCP